MDRWTKKPVFGWLSIWDWTRKKNRKTEEGKGSGGRREGEEGGRKRKGGRLDLDRRDREEKQKEGEIEGQRRKEERGGKREREAGTQEQPESC